jgi:hypothetical protein
MNELLVQCKQSCCLYENDPTYQTLDVNFAYTPFRLDDCSTCHIVVYCKRYIYIYTYSAESKHLLFVDRSKLFHGEATAAFPLLEVQVSSDRRCFHLTGGQQTNGASQAIRVFRASLLASLENAIDAVQTKMDLRTIATYLEFGRRDAVCWRRPRKWGK